MAGHRLAVNIEEIAHSHAYFASIGA